MSAPRCRPSPNWPRRRQLGLQVWLTAGLLVFGRAAAAEPAPAGQLQVPATAGRQPESAPFELPSESLAGLGAPTTQGLEDWFAALSPIGANEAFGSVVIRAGRLVLGRPYAPTVEVPGQEVVDYNVNVFQCVSFVESSLAMARCAWQQDRTAGCFRREVARMRYRHGFMNGFGSRLHYFEDWLEDNAVRGNIALLTDKLSHHTLLRRTAYMTDHQELYPSMRDAQERRRVAAVERRLSHKPVAIVLRDDVAHVARHLIDGDVVAIATHRPDILIRHAGLVDRDSHGVVRMLHASSLRGRVVRTHETLADYLYASPGREGVLLARPLVPQQSPAIQSSAGHKVIVPAQ